MGAVKAQSQDLESMSRAIERFANRNPPPEATERLIPGLLSELDFPKEQYDQYAQRLRAGLYQYYVRRYHPGHSQEQVTLEDEES